MTLRKKIALALFLAVAGFVGFDHVMHAENFEHRFYQLDMEQGKRLSNSVFNGLNRKAINLSSRAQSAAPFLQRVDKEDHQTALEFAQGLGVDVMIGCDADGWVRHHFAIDPDIGESVDIRDLPNQQIGLGHPFSQTWGSLWKDDPSNSRFHGFMLTQRGILAVGAARYQPQGEPEFVMYVGEFLTSARLNAFNPYSSASIQILDAKGLLRIPEEAEVLDTLLSSPEGRVTREVNAQVQTDELLLDITGAPTLILRTKAPRELAQLWFEINQYSILSMIGLAVLFPLVLMLLIQWIITGPLRQLTAFSATIANDQSTELRMALDRKDEIGLLANEFDSMLDQLQASRREVIQTARQAGQSDISMRVLHNVGNMLNSAAVSADLSRDAARELPLKDLERIAQTLRAHEDELQHYLTKDPQGMQLPAFLQALSDELRFRGRNMEAEAMAVSQSLGKIGNLIQTLEGPNRGTGVFESVQLSQVMDAAVELACLAVDSSDLVEIHRRFEITDSLPLDRQKLMEIQVNVLRNAMESALAAGPEPMIEIRTFLDDDQQVCVEIADNGLGIDHDDLARVFAAGQSLKTGRQGLGLHLASTAAMELGGKLWAESSGLGYGAQFVLTVPLKRAAKAA